MRSLLVEYNDTFIEVNSELYKGVISEIQMWGLDNQEGAGKATIQNRWLTSTGKSYSWSSKKANKSYDNKHCVTTTTLCYHDNIMLP